MTPPTENAATENAAHHLTGLRLEEGWIVRDRLASPDDRTDGAFSVGYIAEHDSGTLGFLKACDFAGALDDDDPPRAIERLTAEFNAEKDLLELCGRKGLRKIVRALHAGTVRVEGFRPSAVSYLILELATSDARDVVGAVDFANHFPALSLAHDAAVGLNQLHNLDAAHQDLKPANLLVWQAREQFDGKLGDLGRAHMTGRPSPHDDDDIPGDVLYAAPEQLYRDPKRAGRHHRQAADAYMLGSLTCYLLTGVTHSAMLYLMLDSSQHWTKWDSDFAATLPGLIDAHGRVISKMSPVLNKAIRAETMRTVDELCYPDPLHRGDPVARRRGQNPFQLHRYITRLDLVRRRARIAARAIA